MLRIYYGRERVNRERFLFEKIKECGKALLLVPDQFTLQAEKEAFQYLDVRGLMDVEILSMSRLGDRVLAELGGGKATHIDKYGRHMLLAKIIGEENGNLQVFRNLSSMNSFIDMTNNLISEMKQYNTNPQDLQMIIAELEGDSILKKKLVDIQKIYSCYQQQIEGKYIDTEDYINLFLPKLCQSKIFADTTVWAYGFDYFAPKNLDILQQIMGCCPVNILMTYDKECRDQDLFSLTGQVIYKLGKRAEAQNVPWQAEEIPQAQQHVRAAGILAVERELYSLPVNKQQEAEGIILLKAANLYGEAESAAAFVLSLVRDKGFRYRDIVVICNDLEQRGSIIKRVFSEYGIDLFTDKKRGILHHPAVLFLMSLLDIVVQGWKTRDVLTLLKTGLTSLSTERVWELENYAIKYKIRGTNWKKTFGRGTSEYGEEALAALEEDRAQLAGFLNEFETEFKKAETVKEKISVLYYFLRDRALLPEKLEQAMEEAQQAGYSERAMETAQIWSEIIHIFEQLAGLLGEQTLALDRLCKVMRAGFEAVEIGVLPPSVDGILLGTMQRTRSGAVRAMVVIGANEGILPATPSGEGILSEDEKLLLLGKGAEICKIDELRAKEENLGIYRSISKPSDYLWMSCSVSDAEGNDLKESPVFSIIKNIFPNLQVQKDILNRGNPMDLIETRNNTLKHMTAAVRDSLEGSPLAWEWEAAADWYRRKEPAVLELMGKGLFYENRRRKAEVAFLDKLYKKDGLQDLVLSPSRLEKFSRCPFAHFIAYGLRPEERRVFEIAGREIGDVYHTCLMKLSERLTSPGKAITAEDSLWMKISKEQVDSMVEEILNEEMTSYKEGMLSQGKEEQYRSERIKRVCSDIGWILIGHVQNGQIEEIGFETEFGRSNSKPLPPIEVKLEGENLYIEGKIDRVDVLPGGSVKIIDYKSGRERFDLEEVKSGWRLQLMLYLKAAATEKKPAGVFYFRIEEPLVDAGTAGRQELAEKMKGEILKNFKLDGVMVDDPQVIRSIAGDFSGYSEIAQLYAGSNGIKGSGAGRLLSAEEFSELQQAVDQQVEWLCKELVSGEIAAVPKKSKSASACEYCNYRGICRFDKALPGCVYKE